MKTHYIRFCQAYTDPVWGLEVLYWIQTDLIRVTRNRIQKAVFEWVGCNQQLTQEEMAYYRKHYPIARQVDDL